MRPVRQRNSAANCNSARKKHLRVGYMLLVASPVVAGKDLSNEAACRHDFHEGYIAKLVAPKYMIALERHQVCPFGAWLLTVYSLGGKLRIRPAELVRNRSPPDPEVQPQNVPPRI